MAEWIKPVGITSLATVIVAIVAIAAFFRDSGSSTSDSSPPAIETSTANEGLSVDVSPSSTASGPIAPTTPQPTSIIEPEPTPTPTSMPTTYLATTENQGFDTWPLESGWKVLDGTLLSDGSAGKQIAPFRPAHRDYAVEATMQIIDANFYGVWGVWARSDYVVFLHSEEPGRGGSVEIRAGNSGIYAGDVLETASFAAGNTPHTIRLEVQGTELRVFIDGALLITATDNRHTDPGDVGIRADKQQLSVTSFKVEPLAP